MPEAPPSSPSSSPTSPISSDLDSPPEKTDVPQEPHSLGLKCQARPTQHPGLSTSGSLPQPSRQACLKPPPHRWCQCPAAGGNSPCAGATADRSAPGRRERIHGQDRRARKAAKPGPKGAGDPAGEAGDVGRAAGAGGAPKSRPIGASRLDTFLHPCKRMELCARPIGEH